MRKLEARTAGVSDTPIANVTGLPAELALALKHYPDFATVRALDPAGFADGDLIYIRHHTDATDAGGGVFQWSESATDPDNDGTSLMPSNRDQLTPGTYTTALTGTHNDLVFTNVTLGLGRYKNRIRYRIGAALAVAMADNLDSGGKDITVTLASSATRGTAACEVVTPVVDTRLQIDDAVFYTRTTPSGTYEIQHSATVATLRASIVAAINAANLPRITAVDGAGGAFTLRARFYGLTVRDDPGFTPTILENHSSDAGITIADWTAGTDGSITSTAADVKAAIEASAADDHITVAHAASNDGTGVVTRMGWSFLTGETAEPGRWQRLEWLSLRTVLEARWFRTVADDTAYDNGRAIQAASDALPTSNAIPEAERCTDGRLFRRGTVILPAGRLTAATVISHCAGEITGPGPGACGLVAKSSVARWAREAGEQPEKWLLRTHKPDTVSWNNMFGTIFKGFAIEGAYGASSNTGLSGLYSEGAQLSYIDQVSSNYFGMRGGFVNLNIREIWFTDANIGPALESTRTPGGVHGVVQAEHVNQSGLHKRRVDTGSGILWEAVPAGFFHDLSVVKIDQIQGEGSYVEFLFANCRKIEVGCQIGNGSSGYAVARVVGDSYIERFGPFQIAGTYTYSLSISTALTGDNKNWTPAENLAFYTSGSSGEIHHVGNAQHRGVYADDAAAAAAGVPVNSTYRKASGVLAWRQT